MRLSDFKAVPTKPDEFVKYLIERMSRVIGAHVKRNESRCIESYLEPIVEDLTIPSVHVLNKFIKKNKMSD